jgi:hypothetical protein
MGSYVCETGKSCRISGSKFVRDGYTFRGWSTSREGKKDEYGWTNWSGTWNFKNGERGIKNNTLTLFAIWVKVPGNPIQIKYVSNGGSGSMSSHVCNRGSRCAIKANTFSREGYDFIGWTTRSDGIDDGFKWTNWNGTWMYHNGYYGIKNNTLTLYAMWEKENPNKYTINYYGNGATGGYVPSTICVTGTECVLEFDGYTRDGYIFTGWTTRSDGIDDGYGWTGFGNIWKYTNGEWGISKNTLNLYAKWMPLGSQNGYRLYDSYTSPTLVYNIYKNNKEEYISKIWVADSYKQFKVALYDPHGQGSANENAILTKEINQNGYQNKGLIAVNGSFFENKNSSKSYISKNVIINNGVAVRDKGNSSAVISVSASRWLNQFVGMSSSEILSYGVKYTAVISSDVDGKKKDDTSQKPNDRTIICQIGKNAFIIGSCKTTYPNLCFNKMKEFGCSIGYNLDGSASQRLTIKKNTNNLKEVIHNSRLIPDMVYLVEQ